MLQNIKLALKWALCVCANKNQPASQQADRQTYSISLQLIISMWWQR